MYRSLSRSRSDPILQCLISKLLNAKTFYIITCSIVILGSFLWFGSVDQTSQNNDHIVQEAISNAATDPRYAEVYRKSTRLPNDTKYLLLWTPTDFAPFYYLGRGQKAFIDSNCSMINCFITDDRNFFNGDVTKFHAIGFNGRNIQDYRKWDLPKHRSPHQKYIFFNMESADNYPVCSQIYDNFFNWTSTYRLDSDLPFTYMKIRDKEGNIVGPKKHMQWRQNMTVDDSIVDILKNKSEAAAWFVSHCVSRSGRKDFVRKLQLELKSHQLKVDVYGSCGPLKCPVQDKNKCNNLLEEKYMFYLSLENSFAEDYVTEKLLTAVQHHVVPIVYGGADYSRFLPPDSYLDGRELSPKQLASTMVHLVKQPELYKEFFRWKSYYSYHDPSDNVCSVCEALNNVHMLDTTSVYKHFRKWWNPEFAERCKKL